MNLTVVGAASETEYYVAYQTTKHGIAGVTLGASAGASAPVYIEFADPTSLGAGTYEDTLQLSVATDAAGTHLIAGSPQTITTTYTVSPAVPPTISSFNPPSATAGGQGFTLAITGTLFYPLTQVQWNGSNRKIVFVSSTQLTLAVTATDLETAGTATVTASNMAYSGGLSAPASFSIDAPQFSIRAVSPTTVPVGGPAFILTVYGSLFTANSSVQWNGSARATTYVSPSQLTAQVLASDLMAVGSAAVTVLNPGSPGSLSGPFPVTINPGDAVAIQMDTGHSGVTQFPSFALPAASLWSVTLDGPPSYALIAQGKVYVTTLPVTGGSELVALDQATGAIAWGPLALDGVGSSAYDNGKVFVATGNGVLVPATVQAYDAGTGTAGWSSALPDGTGAYLPPTAANGLVYANSLNGDLTAFNETNGALAWYQFGGFCCSPAVAPGGVFTSYTNNALAFDPASGTQLWSDSQGIEGGGGGTPVVANGQVYAPDGFGTYSGQVLNAATGAVVGAYAADNLPAIAAQNGFFLQGGILRGIHLSDGTTMWSFVGDGQLVTSPIVVNNVVFIGSSSGNLYGLDASTGTQVWQMTLTAPLPKGAGWNAIAPLSGLAAGDGLLVVPAGNTLTAFQLGAQP